MLKTIELVNTEENDLVPWAPRKMTHIKWTLVKRLQFTNLDGDLISDIETQSLSHRCMEVNFKTATKLVPDRSTRIS